MLPPPPRSTLFPYTTLFRSLGVVSGPRGTRLAQAGLLAVFIVSAYLALFVNYRRDDERSEEHTSELQSPYDLVCRLLLEKKKKKTKMKKKTIKKDMKKNTNK